MKRFLAWFTVVFGAAFALAFLSPGCSNPCDDLAEVCARCGDATYRAACETVVARANGSVCSEDVRNFTAFCTAEGQGGAGQGGGTTGDGPCVAGESRCLNQCVNLLSNATFCGSCNTACAEGELCVAGTCTKADACPPSLPDATPKGGCTDRDTDPTCCGSDCSRCASTLACIDGVCAEPSSCKGNVCSGACTSLFDDPLNCGKCGNVCKAGQVCAAGSCATNCGEKLTQCCGKCVDVTSDPVHCGGCDPSCPEAAALPPNTLDPTSVCPDGHAACGGDTGICLKCTCVNETTCKELAGKTNCDGSCVDIQSDAKNCGACGVACGAGKKCANGACIAGECPAGQTDCNGSCVDLQKDPNNCGSCGTLCPTASAKYCVTGLCESGCALPKQDCKGVCADVSKDPKNCGGCGLACKVGEVCVPDGQGSGACQDGCPSGLTNCGGSCVDLRQDFNHCGACGNTCNDDNVCTADTCVFGSKGGTCLNESGAKLCPGTKNPCLESKCDPKKGCVVTPLSAGAILAGCTAGTSPPSGWSPNDLAGEGQLCLWCDPTAAEGTNPCRFDARSDGLACSSDTCDPNRTAKPSNTPIPDFCKQNGDPCEQTACGNFSNPQNLTLNPATGCQQNNALCTGKPEGGFCCPSKTNSVSGCATKQVCAF